MVPSRRRALRVGGAAALTALAGCGATLPGSSDDASEYSLTVDAIDASPVEHALYEPDDGALFGAPARAALADVLPDGRHTTYGYKPLPSDAYVAHGGSYYQTKHVVTGRTRMDRRLVRVDPVPEGDVPDDAVLVDSLARPTERTLEILHSYTRTDGETSTADLLRGDAYVLRRPAERQSRLVTGDLDGRVVTMTEGGAWAYRVGVTTEPVLETAYTALAIEVADSRPRFREVVFGSRIDAELAPADLPSDARDVLEGAVARETYVETTPLSDPFEAVLGALGLGAVDTAATGRRLWYDGAYYRYALYVSPASS
jgi:hypothetical protein